MEAYVRQGYDTLAVTVMPGPQLKQAIPYTKKLKERFLNWSPSGEDTCFQPVAGLHGFGICGLPDLWAR